MLKRQQLLALLSITIQLDRALERQHRMQTSTLKRHRQLYVKTTVSKPLEKGHVDVRNVRLSCRN
jgi:hypothetical protein